jgi:hypothetical protein
MRENFTHLARGQYFGMHIHWCFDVFLVGIGIAIVSLGIRLTAMKIQVGFTALSLGI